MPGGKYTNSCDVCHSWYCCPANHIETDLTPNHARNLAKAELAYSGANRRSQMLAKAVLRYIPEEEEE